MTLDERLEAAARGWRGPLLAALIALIAGLPGLIAMPPLDRDESRFAQATTQMLETGDFVAIQFQDQPRYKKPIGIHWLQAVAVAALSEPAGRDIWAFRIPSLLGAMLAAAACAWGAAAFLGPRLGLIAGGLFGATFLLSSEAFIAKTDAVLAGAVTLALAALGRLYLAARDGPPAGRRIKFAFWLAIAAAALVKGPVGPGVAALTLMALWAADRDARWMKDIGWGWGLVLVAAVVGPWAAAITVATDGAFWSGVIAGDLAPKVRGGHEEHWGLPGYYLALSPMILFPASLLLPAAAVHAWKHRKEPGVRFALCWLIPAWLVFELMPTKLVHYTLPTLGAACWLMAGALRGPIGPWATRAGTLLLGAAGLAYAAVAVFGLSQFGDAGDVTEVALTAGLFAAAGLVGAIMFLRGAPVPAVVTAGALGVIAHGVFAAALLPALEPLWISRETDEALRRTGLHPREGVAPGPVAVAGYSEPSLVFALGTGTGLGDAEDAAEAIAQGRPAVVEARQEPAFRRALAARGLRPAPAASVSGLNYSNGDELTLTIYRGRPQRITAPPISPQPTEPAP